jgi:hypothetical protein
MIEITNDILTVEVQFRSNLPSAKRHRRHSSAMNSHVAAMDTKVCISAIPADGLWFDE